MNKQYEFERVGVYMFYYRMYNPVPIFTKKEPPMKGTKRWNKQQKAIKRKERKREIWNVMNLIDSLSSSACVAHA